MASIDVAKLLNKITQDIPGINTVLKALAKWDVSALTDVPDGAMQATTDENNNLTIKKKVSGTYTSVAKLMHDVDKLDGYHASASATANTVAVRNASGALPGNILGNAATATTATALATGSVVPVNQGGTGATTASQARANLGVADGEDYATHIATNASTSVFGHVKLDALAADGSNTAAPGGFGLGMPEATQIPANTDLNTVVLPGFYSCKMTNTATTLTNCPVVIAFSMFVEYGSYGPTQTITSYNNGARFQRTKTSSTTFGPWRSLPNGISDSTATTSSTIAASATAVKAAYDKATTATNATSPATTTARGIGRVATSADLVDGATINNGPAFLAAGVNAAVASAAGKVPVANASGKVPEWAFDVGDLMPSFASSKSGFLLCNGGAYSRTTYAALFAILGTSFGAGDGSTTFNVPDFRGRTIQGANANLKAILAAGLPDIIGDVSRDTGVGFIDSTGTGVSGAFVVGARSFSIWCTSSSQSSKSIGFRAGAYDSIYGAATTVQPPAIAANIFIKY